MFYIVTNHELLKLNCGLAVYNLIETNSFQNKTRLLYRIYSTDQFVVCYPSCFPASEFLALVVWDNTNKHLRAFVRQGIEMTYAKCESWRQEGKSNTLAKFWQILHYFVYSILFSQELSGLRFSFLPVGSSLLKLAPEARTVNFWPQVGHCTLFLKISLCLHLVSCLLQDLVLAPFFTLPIWMNRQRESKFAFPRENYLQQCKMKLYTSN